MSTVAGSGNASYHQTKQSQIKPLLRQNLGGVEKKNIVGEGENADDLLKA